MFTYMTATASLSHRYKIPGEFRGSCDTTRQDKMAEIASDFPGHHGGAQGTTLCKGAPLQESWSPEARARAAHRTLSSLRDTLLRILQRLAQERPRVFRLALK